MVRLMRKSVLFNCLFIFTVVFIIAACKFDPIFYTIHQEVEPIDPRIKGAPSNFVLYKGAMYVASSDVIHYYNGTWGKINPPEEGWRILQIAVTQNTEYLYALCYKDGSSKIEYKVWRYNGIWEGLGGVTDDYNSIRHIFAAGDVLFIGAEYKADSNIYSILYVDNSETAIKSLNQFGEISGASYVGGFYYISTRNDGIFRTNDPASGATLFGGAGIDFMGMIKLNDTTIALITRDGEIYTINGSTLQPSGISFGGRYSTGALAIWEKNSNKLLLAGRQDSLEYSVDSGYTYGYMELELNADGSIRSNTSFLEPGNRPNTTIKDGENDRYKSTIGKHPVNHIFQAPNSVDSNMTLFASTQKNGVWSYRERSGGWQWNAEE